MNFYPFLAKSYHASKSILLFMVANSSTLLMSALFLCGWLLWYDSFFLLLRHTLQETHVTGEVAGQLIAQAYRIGAVLIFIAPIVLIIWRISIPFTYARLNLLEEGKPMWHIFVFDSSKVATAILITLLMRYSWINGYWLAFIVGVIATIMLFSFIRFSEIIYFSTPQKHRLKTLLLNWFSHSTNILFLHGIDTLVLIIGFCMLGVLIASFTYLPFVLATLILLIIVLIWGKLLLIWKGFWSYAAYALISQQ